MENDINDHTNLNDNKENVDEIKKVQKIIDKLKTCPKIKKGDSSKKILLFSFMILIFIIYSINILTSKNTIITIKNFSFSSNKDKLNKTEEILAKLQPSPS